MLCHWPSYYAIQEDRRYHCPESSHFGGFAKVQAPENFPPPPLVHFASLLKLASFSTLGLWPTSTSAWSCSVMVDWSIPDGPYLALQLWGSWSCSHWSACPTNHRPTSMCCCSSLVSVPGWGHLHTAHWMQAEAASNEGCGFAPVGVEETTSRGVRTHVRPPPNISVTSLRTLFITQWNNSGVQGQVQD